MFFVWCRNCASTDALRSSVCVTKARLNVEKIEVEEEDGCTRQMFVPRREKPVETEREVSSAEEEDGAIEDSSWLQRPPEDEPTR
jgi:hypothetical protein